jgi:hypothetical protein
MSVWRRVCKVLVWKERTAIVWFGYARSVYRNSQGALLDTRVEVILWSGRLG